MWVDGQWFLTYEYPKLKRKFDIVSLFESAIATLTLGFVGFVVRKSVNNAYIYINVLTYVFIFLVVSYYSIFYYYFLQRSGCAFISLVYEGRCQFKIIFANTVLKALLVNNVFV